MFQTGGAAAEGLHYYEERITLWRASDPTNAIESAEQEAEDYARELGLTYLGLAQAYRIADPVRHGSEVFSLIRASSLDSPGYLSAFFDTGTELTSE